MITPEVITSLNEQSVQKEKGRLIRSRSILGGIVQGVGFRPAVYRAAVELDVSGWVCNSAEGVVIEAEGDPSTVTRFLQKVIHDPPPGARVVRLSDCEIETCGSMGFEIRPSLAGTPVSWVPPDLATCDACLEEIRDPDNRRFGYPFTNCTHCGPRFSIIRSLPYDRKNTTMDVFEQCPECEQEYGSPADRRFHAQPNACNRCGPSIELVDGFGNILGRRSDALADAAQRILQGEIVAVKGLGGFHLMTRAGSTAAVARLRKRKQREEKPLAILCSDLEMASQICEVDSEAATLLVSPEAPIVLLRRRTLPDPWSVSANSQIAPGAGRLGVMLAYTPLHHLLMDEVEQPIIATSGNVSDEPICIDNDEAIQRLGNIADVFLMHDRSIERAVDDSVVQIVSGGAQILRRARGFAPLPIRIPSPTSSQSTVSSQGGPGHFSTDNNDRELVSLDRATEDARSDGASEGPATVLAVGAHQKNTVTLLHGSDAFISQHIGDLNTLAAIGAFEKSVVDLPHLYKCVPSIHVKDLHPDYASSVFADGIKGRSVVVQHHVAHILSGIAEHDISTPVLGICWDGTGLGTDGTIWGGEAFVVIPPNGGNVADATPQESGFQVVDFTGSISGAFDSLVSTMAEGESVKRVATIRPFRLVGGDRAAREPRRSALGLWDAAGRPDEGREVVQQLFSASEWRLLISALDRETSTHVTTSAGRLFDGLSALVSRRGFVSYEAQAAVALEELAWSVPGSSTAENEVETPLLRLGRTAGGDHSELDWRPLFSFMLRQDVPAQIRALAAHVALARSVAAIAELAPGLPVLFTGGCFQNRLLTELSERFLVERGCKVYIHRRVPPNDGGISLGQALAARWASAPGFSATDFIRSYPAG